MKKRGVILIPVLIVCLIVTVIVGLFAAGLTGRYMGTGSMRDGEADAGGVDNGYDCSGVSNVPAQYRDWVQKASATHLNGDEAALAALIQTESMWRANASNPNSSAAGLGQFINSTARGFKEYVGGNDKHGNSWPTGTVYDNPSAHSNDARFDAHRAIFATAHLFGGKIEQYGNPGDAYEKGYHTWSNESQRQAALTARGIFERAYNKLKNGCIQREANYAVSSGTFCPPLGEKQKNANSKPHGNGVAGIFVSTRGFKTRAGGAIDWGNACACGRPNYPVYSTFDGTVTKINRDYYSSTGGGRAGDIVNIVSNDKKHEAVYAHINAGSLKTGMKINKCAQIGTVAGPPKTVIDPHLHFQFWHHGQLLSSNQLYEFFKPDN